VEVCAHLTHEVVEGLSGRCLYFSLHTRSKLDGVSPWMTIEAPIKICGTRILSRASFVEKAKTSNSVHRSNSCRTALDLS